MVFNILNTTNYGMMQNQMAAGLWNAAAKNCSFWSVMTPSCFPTIMLDPRFLLQRNSIFPAFGNQSNNQSWQNWIMPSNKQTQGTNNWDGFWEAWNKNNKKVETDSSEDVAEKDTVTPETRVENLTALLTKIKDETNIADTEIENALKEAETKTTTDDKLKALNKVFDGDKGIKFKDIKNCLDQKDNDLLVQAGLASKEKEEDIKAKIVEIKEAIKNIKPNLYNTDTLTGYVRDNQIDIFDLVAGYPNIITDINTQKAKIIDPEDRVPCNNTIKLICNNLISRAKEIDETGLKDEIEALENAKDDKIQEAFDKLYVAARLKAEENVITHLKEKYSNEIVNDKTFNVEGELLSDVYKGQYKTAIKAYNEKEEEAAAAAEVNNDGKAEQKDTSTSQKKSETEGKKRYVLNPKNIGIHVAKCLDGYTTDDEGRSAAIHITNYVDEDNIIHFLLGYNQERPSSNIFEQLITEWSFNNDEKYKPNTTKEECFKHLTECVIKYLENNTNNINNIEKETVEKDIKSLNNFIKRTSYDRLTARSIYDIVRKYISAEKDKTINPKYIYV